MASKGFSPTNKKFPVSAVIFKCFELTALMTASICLLLPANFP